MKVGRTRQPGDAEKRVIGGLGSELSEKEKEKERRMLKIIIDVPDHKARLEC